MTKEELAEWIQEKCLEIFTAVGQDKTIEIDLDVSVTFVKRAGWFLERRIEVKH